MQRSATQKSMSAPWGGCGWPSGAVSLLARSATIASVVISRPAIDAASCEAVRTTLVGRFQIKIIDQEDCCRARKPRPKNGRVGQRERTRDAKHDLMGRGAPQHRNQHSCGKNNDGNQAPDERALFGCPSRDLDHLGIGPTLRAGVGRGRKDDHTVVGRERMGDRADIGCRRARVRWEALSGNQDLRCCADAARC